MKSEAGIGRKRARYRYHKVYLHRVIAAKQLGRELFKGEVVHHIDGNSENNDPDNLEVCRSAAVHRQHHRKSIRDLVAADRPLEQVGDLWF
jgi:hypothetical protein